MREFRKLSQSDLRNLCIEENWYTNGNGQEYDEMLNIANVANLTTNDIAKIANNIKAHSDTEHDITSICFEIARKCYSLFEI